MADAFAAQMEANMMNPPHRQEAEMLPPHDVTAEEAVIAALLLDEDAVSRIGAMLTPDDFFREQHGWVWQAATDLAARGEPVTVPTVAHELERAGVLDRFGGEPELLEILGRHFTAQGVEAHARMVLRDSVYRRIIHAAGRITARAWSGGADVELVVRDAASTFTSLSADFEKRSFGKRESRVRGFRI